jgi:replicative DNA helicase
MANYELHLLSKVLTAKDPDHAWKEINELMGYRNMFQVYQDEFDALTKFRDKYKKFPTKDTFLKQNPRIEDLPKATDPIRFYVDEVRDSFTYAKMSELNELLVTELRKGNSQDAYRKVTSELAKMQFMAKAGRTINMADTVDDRLKSYDLRRTEQAVNGIPTGWNTLDLETTGWQDGELSLILGRMGSFKCVDIDSRVRLMDGTIKTLRYCRDNGIDRIHSYDESSGKMVVSKVNALVETGYKDGFEVVTASGKRTRVSEIHPYLTDSGWRKAFSLKVGDRVAVPRVTRFEFTDSVSYDKAYFLGIMLAEGGLTKGEPIFSSGDKEVVDWARLFCAKHGMRLSIVDKYTFRFAGDRKKNVTNEWLSEFGMKGKSAWDKAIPDAAMRWNLRSKSVMIAAMFDGDGHVTKHGDLVYTTVSSELAHQLSTILLEFGIVSSLQYYEYRTSSFWRVTIYKDNASIFARCMPKLIKRKQQKLEAGLKRKMSYVDGVDLPEHLRESLREAIRAYSPTKLGKFLGWVAKPNFGFLNGKQRISRHQLGRICQELSDGGVLKSHVLESIREFVNREIYMDEVVAITPIHDIEMVDLEVEGTHNFVVENTLVHNTWVLLAWASYCWTTGKVPVVFSREMPAQQIMRRVDAILTRVRFNDLRKGSLSDKDFKTFGKNIKALYHNKHPFFVVDAAGNSRFDVEFIQRTIAELQVDAAYIDGAYMLEAPGSSIWEKQTSISRGLKQVCISELVPMVATSQANRGAAGKTAKIGNENAAYSDSWSQDADNIIALMRVWDEHYQQYKDEILVETTKLREGDPVSLQIHVDLDGMAFNEGLDIQSKDEGTGFEDWNPTEQTSLL